MIESSARKRDVPCALGTNYEDMRTLIGRKKYLLRELRIDLEEV